MALPAILSCRLLIFVLAAEMYAIPGIIGQCRTHHAQQIYKIRGLSGASAHTSAAIMLLLLTVRA